MPWYDKIYNFGSPLDIIISQSQGINDIKIGKRLEETFDSYNNKRIWIDFFLFISIYKRILIIYF